jgi:Fe2+ or Zn2+ uptake regulation protein
VKNDYHNRNHSGFYPVPAFVREVGRHAREGRMRLTLTQQVIMAEIRKSGSITARRVMEITGCVYRDSMDYVYQTLGRMVKAGLIKRTGIGVFVAVEGDEL